MEMLEMAHRPPFLYFVIWWKSFSNRALLIVYEIFFKRLILHKTRSYPIPFLVIVTVRDTECLMVPCLSCRWEGKRRELGWTEGKLFTAPLFYYQRAIMLQLPSTSPPQTSHPPPLPAPPPHSTEAAPPGPRQRGEEMSPLPRSRLRALLFKCWSLVKWSMPGFSRCFLSSSGKPELCL